MVEAENGSSESPLLLLLRLPYNSLNCLGFSEVLFVGLLFLFFFFFLMALQKNLINAPLPFDAQPAV